jgi:tripartite-type tricarboxylate transporter receptor subunit TctC
MQLVAKLKIAVLVMTGCAVVALPATAQTYPSKPVRMVVGFAPGGDTDIVARLVADHLNKAWGQSVIVENKVGAGGNISADEVARAPADGHTLLVGGVGALAANPAMYASMPFDPGKDFRAITLLVFVPVAVAINAALPAANLREFVAYAKSKAGAINHSSPGVGSFPHLAAELLRMQASFESVHIPFRGSSPATQALAMGEVQWNVDSLKLAVTQHKAGKARVIAVTSASRLKGNEDLPTAAEAGMPGMTVSAWFALVAPAGTPEPVIQKINEEVTRGLRSEEFGRRLEPLGHQAAPMTPAETTTFLAAERQRWAQVIQANGIKAE